MLTYHPIRSVVKGLAVTQANNVAFSLAGTPVTYPASVPVRMVTVE
ncbi:MAG: hypothetical protein AB7F96_16410 [Beijerinckiaceae bacterium]